jgi:hypothetical protein
LTESGRASFALISALAFYLASSLLSTFVFGFDLGTSSSNIDFFSPKTLPSSPDNLFFGFSSSSYLPLLACGKISYFPIQALPNRKNCNQSHKINSFIFN